MLCPSGLNALSTTIEGLYDYYQTEQKKPIVILADVELYGSSRYALLHFGKRNPAKQVHVQFVDFTDETKIQKSFQTNKDHILFCESCSNPSGRMIPIHSIAKMCQKELENRFCLVVDNSWLSILFNPLDVGAHIMIESASKYMGGGDIIMGIVTTREEKWFTPIKTLTKQYGIRVSPTDAYTLCKALETLEMRVKKSAATTLQIAKWMESKDAPRMIEKVQYPLLASHATYDVAKTLLASERGPSVLIFRVPEDRKACIGRIDQSSVIHFATSYGKSLSLFDPWPKRCKEGTWIRLAIGFAQTFEEIRDELIRLFNS